MDHDPILAFLNDAQARWGRRSVVYVSFGTVIWPTLRPWLVEEILQTLIELGVPFIMATASAHGKLSKEMKARVNASGLGIVSDWVPQLKVLQHEATAVLLVSCP